MPGKSFYFFSIADVEAGFWKFNSCWYTFQVEVFNYLFIREQKKKRHVVHCIDCARKQNSNLNGFVCLEEYKLVELVEVYDSFRLCLSSSKILPLPSFIPKNKEDKGYLLPQTVWSTSQASQKPRKNDMLEDPPLCWQFKKIRRSTSHFFIISF